MNNFYGLSNPRLCKRVITSLVAVALLASEKSFYTSSVTRKNLFLPIHIPTTSYVERIIQRKRGEKKSHIINLSTPKNFRCCFSAWDYIKFFTLSIYNLTGNDREGQQELAFINNKTSQKQQHNRCSCNRHHHQQQAIKIQCLQQLRT